jgi:protein-glutamine gamma-glutamyltransferase
LGDGTYFGHGLGIKTADQIIHTLNQSRTTGAKQSAYLTNVVARPAFNHLAELSISQPVYSIFKYQRVVVPHNKSSVSFDRFVYL